MAKSIDIGTCFLASASRDDNQQIQIKSIRDAFFDLENEPQVKSMLTMSKVSFIEAGDKLYIIGDPALVMANMFRRELRRPLSQGIISAGETEAEKVLSIMIENVVGRAKNDNETCFFSVPAGAIDRTMDIIYHQAMFSKILSGLGYKAISMNEAAAVAYSNASKENFSALVIDLGAGMVNVCLIYQTMIGMTFSISRSGDWVDESAARVTGSTAGRIMAIKEKGTDLIDISQGDIKTLREREAIQVYYKSLVMYALDAIKNEFARRKAGFELPTAVPIILAGGTSLAKGFKEFFETAFTSVRDKFPFAVSEIRMATDPLNAVAQGLLIAAMHYDEGSRK